MPNIIGLDISTSCIGHAAVDQSSGKIIWCNFLKFHKDDTLEDKFEKYVDSISSLITSHDTVYIEEYMQYFKGRSNARTMTLLAHFNGMIRGELMSSNLPVYHIGPAEARKKLGFKAKKPKGYPSIKEYILEEIQKKKLDNLIPMCYISKGKNKGRPKPEVYDASDALVIALAGWKDVFEQEQAGRTR